MVSKVWWGVLGSATIAKKCMLAAIQSSANGDVYAIASRSVDRAGELAKIFSIPKIYGDYQSLLDDPKISAVYIPLPNHLHLPWTLKAFAAGKHVLVEKPIACNAKQAGAMADAARAANRLLMEAFMYRFHPRSIMIKKKVEAGDIGQLRYIRAAFSFHIDTRILASATNARLQPDMGGGALLDVGSYGVSVARWFAGAEPLSVQALAGYHPGGVDWLFSGILDFGNDCLASVEAGFIAALQQTYALIGENGAIELPHNAFVPWEKDCNFQQREQEQEVGVTVEVSGVDEYRLMVEHFADAVLQNTALAYLPEDSIANMLVLDGLAEAAKSGKRVIL